jgi:hypothetical protein
VPPVPARYDHHEQHEEVALERGTRAPPPPRSRLRGRGHRWCARWICLRRHLRLARNPVVIGTEHVPGRCIARWTGHESPAAVSRRGAPRTCRRSNTSGWHEASAAIPRAAHPPSCDRGCRSIVLAPLHDERKYKLFRAATNLAQALPNHLLSALRKMCPILDHLSARY